MMRDVEEMTTAETAECLSLTEDNVKIRVHRAHGMLRRELYQIAKISAADAADAAPLIANAPIRLPKAAPRS